VEIFPGFAAAEVLYDEAGASRRGHRQHGHRKTASRPPVPAGHGTARQVHAVRRGARGHLGKQVIRKYALDSGRDPQTGHRHQGGVGARSIEARAGLVLHSAGWPLDNSTYGGGFMYHFENNQVSLGLVVGLGYTNPYLEPFQEFQRYKTHRPSAPSWRRQAGRLRRAAINASGLQSLPKLAFPGALIGCDAGFLNAHGSRARTRRSRAACWPPRRGRGARAGGPATNLPPTRPPSRRAGCTTSFTARATSSRTRQGLATGAVLWASTRSSSAAKRRGRCTGRLPTTRSCDLRRVRTD